MTNKVLRLVLGVFFISCLSLSSFAATITVTSFQDSGGGSLRAALASAMGGETIIFSIGGNSITVYSPLDVVTQVTIEGAGTQVVGAIDGSVTTTFNVTAANTIIQNLAVVDGTIGINVSSADNVQIVGCAIGTDFFDATGRGISESGVRINQSDGVRVGAPGQENIIGACQYGIQVLNSAGTLIRSNYIGVASDGVTPLPNATAGIFFNTNVWGCMIGGDSTASQGNVISGNTNQGVYLGSPDVGGNSICGNIIGLTAAGAVGPGNGSRGVNMLNASGNWVGIPVNNYGNLIAGNNAGIYLSGTSDDNTIQNNVIGLDLAGNIAGNSYGVFIYGGDNNLVGGNRGTGSYEGNVISGQTAYDVYFYSTADGNSLCGNYIGTSIDGTASRSTSAQGVYITGAGNLIGGPNVSASIMYGNVISGHASMGRNGIAITGGTGNTVVGNIIGLNAAGDAAIPNYYGVQLANLTTQGNLIGGTGSVWRNYISGNSYTGVRVVDAADHRIIGNYIGLNVAGDDVIENTTNGIRLQNSTDIVIGGQNAGEGNFVSGSTYGINFSLDSQNNTVVGNFIGVQSNLSASTDPPSSGIYVTTSQDNFIGIRDTGAGNLIANCINGVLLGGDSVRTFVYGNTICANSTAQIHFMTSGTTANNDKPSPVITGAYTTYVEGTAQANDFIELFKAENGAGPNGSLSYVGSATADGSGNWTKTGLSLSVGEYVIATATDLTNGTSEFSVNHIVTLPPTPTFTSTVSPTSTQSPTVTQTPTVTSTPTITQTETSTPTITSTPTLTATPTISPTETVTATVTPTPSITRTSTISPTSTTTPTATQTPENNLEKVDLAGKSVLAYPNPGRDKINFLMHLTAATKVSVQVYNAAGERAVSLTAALPAGRGQVVSWQCGNAAPGIYIAKVYFNGSEKQTIKLAVVK